MSTVSTVNGGISFWYAQEGTPTPREPLPGDASADVCIVGGGYTGLWTAYYLKKAVPFLNITVLEAKFCGYGASGRNGAGCTTASRAASGTPSCTATTPPYGSRRR
ncbi:hypothetical protein SMICM17S_05544 [Streptomyces microflavus]